MPIAELTRMIDPSDTPGRATERGEHRGQNGFCDGQAALEARDHHRGRGDHAGSYRDACRGRGIDHATWDQVRPVKLVGAHLVWSGSRFQPVRPGQLRVRLTPPIAASLLATPPRWWLSPTPPPRERH